MLRGERCSWRLVPKLCLGTHLPGETPFRGDQRHGWLRSGVSDIGSPSDLCIADDTPHGRHLVFPSQYRRERDLPHEPDIFVSYSSSGEWQTVWTTLVVRLWYGQEFA